MHSGLAFFEAHVTFYIGAGSSLSTEHFHDCLLAAFDIPLILLLKIPPFSRPWCFHDQTDTTVWSNHQGAGGAHGRLLTQLSQRSLMRRGSWSTIYRVATWTISEEVTAACWCPCRYRWSVAENVFYYTFYTRICIFWLFGTQEKIWNAGRKKTCTIVHLIVYTAQFARRIFIHLTARPMDCLETFSYLWAYCQLQPQLDTSFCRHIYDPAADSFSLFMLYSFYTDLRCTDLFVRHVKSTLKAVLKSRS